MKKTLVTTAVALLIYFVIGLINKTEPAIAQSTGTIDLSPSCTSCEIGSDLVVTVSAVASASPIGAAEINLNYDKAKLQFQSVAYFSGANDFSDHFSEVVNQDIAVIHVEAGKPGGLSSGSGRIFSASFKVLSAGNASISAGPIDGANQDGRVFLTANSLDVSLIAASSSTTAETGNTAVNTNKSTSKSTQKAKATTYDFSKSEVSFDKTNVLPDGNDKICASILVKNFGKIVTNLKPTIKSEGGLDLGDITLSKNNWSVCATSKLASSKRLMVSVKNILIKDQTIIFSLPFVEEVKIVEPVEKSVNDVPENIIQQLSTIKGNVLIASKNDLLNKKEITDVDLVEISGTADPGTSLKLYIHSPVLIQKDVKVGSDGKWSAKIDRTLSSGTHRVEAAVVDDYNQESDTRLIAKFTVAKSKNKSAIIIAVSSLVLLLAIVFYLIRRKKRMSQIQSSPEVVSEPILPPEQLPPNETIINSSTDTATPREANVLPTVDQVPVVPPQAPAVNTAEPRLPNQPTNENRSMQDIFK